MKGAKGVLINITGGPDMTLFEVDEAANRIRREVDPTPTSSSARPSTRRWKACRMARVGGAASRLDAPPPASAAPKAEPRLSAPAARPAQPAPAAQPKLGGLEAPTQGTPGGGQEDLLDIPAFLRRQAN
jgi:cell division protein FtsZ